MVQVYNKSVYRTVGAITRCSYTDTPWKIIIQSKIFFIRFVNGGELPPTQIINLSRRYS